MKIVERLSITELRAMAESMYGDLVKADVDTKKGLLIVDMEMHADGEAELLSQGSQQTDIWGVNVYPDKFGTPEFIEFDSMINIRPRQNNMSRGVEDAAVRSIITELIGKIVYE